MSCPYCEAEETWPSGSASFSMYECGTRYDDGDYTQSDYCESLEMLAEQKEKILKAKIGAEVWKLRSMIWQVKAKTKRSASNGT
jgi:hypothetical protein